MAVDFNDIASIYEGDSRIIFVRLTVQPSGNVTVNLPQPSNTDVKFHKSSLTFTPSNWDRSQTVVVSTAKDADELDDTATITLRASGGGYDGVAASTSLTVIDDGSNKLSLSPSPLSLDEGGTGYLRVALKARPFGKITVQLTKSGDLMLNRTSLTFTSYNWGAKSVTVTGGHDDDIADDIAQISLRASGAVQSPRAESVQVNVTDDDGVLILSSSELALDEGGSGTFTVRLGGRPSGTVTVSLTEPGDLTLVGKTLTFTTLNWDREQTVTVDGGTGRRRHS